MNDKITSNTTTPESSYRGLATPEPSVPGLGAGVDSWEQVVTQAAVLIDDPELIALSRLVVEGRPPPNVALAVHLAVVNAVGRCTSPTIVHECLALLLDSSPALQLIGEQLSGTCLQLARPPAFDAAPRAWLLAADGLEAATRLALGGWGNRFALLAQLVQVPPVSPPLFARSALRCLAASYEQWREPELIRALERLAGVVPVFESVAGERLPVDNLQVDVVPVDAGTATQWAHDIAPDAAYELGCASLLQALRVNTLLDAEEHLKAAERRLVAAAPDRIDAAVLADVARLLTVHLPTNAGRAAWKATDLTALAGQLEQHVREHVLGYTGLDHWRAPRLDAEVAWAQLARDVATTSVAMQQVSWYQAETVLADVLAAYTASRCSRVLCREDQTGIRAILGPAIESGIAARAGLMQHLEDHIAALEDTKQTGAQRISPAARPPELTTRTAELAAARSLLAAAQAELTRAEPDPKSSGGVDSIPPDSPATLPLLHQLVQGDRAALAGLSPEVAQRLEAALATRRDAPTVTGGGRDTLVVCETYARLQNDLAASSYYHGEVQEVIDELTLLLLRFWVSRDGLNPSRNAYLFTPDALEEDLARDLKVFLDGSPMAALLTTEARDVGGGRVDVACSFPRFRLYIELKRDDRQSDVADKRSFLAQTAGYQGADVPIGFLAVLDLRPRTGPTPHLSACFGVVVLDDADLGTPRHIVTMLVPGNRTPPSAMR